MTSETEAIAITGIGCRLPRGIESPAALWSFVASGQDGITEIPEQRWSRSAFHHPDPAVAGASYSRWAGLVENPEMFDAGFFGVTPREARRLDPQQRWFLECVWRAFEDAGQRLEDIRGQPIGVFVGCSSSDYGEIQRRWRYDADVHTNTGAAVSLVANRVSYQFDLRGPSLVVDTACSSSLVALDLAVRAIRTGQCRAAVVGGVNALFMPEATIGFSKASMLSPDGRCKAFAAAANGYVRAEGAVAVVLKPLEQALREHDRIYACVLATAVNQDGETHGITVPSEPQQRAMLDQAYAAAGVDRAWIGGVEAHGTGTPVGDPIEARALGLALGAGRHADRPLLLGSVKTNLGHLEPASGAIGLAKLALSLHRGEFAPSLHFGQPNPAIDFAGLGLAVPISLQPWPAAPDRTRYGGVNSFGFGGTNAHAVLSTPPAHMQPSAGRTTLSPTVRSPIIWPLSARSVPALEKAASEAALAWGGMEQDEVRRLAVTQARRRTAHPFRLPLVADDAAGLVAEVERLDLKRLARRAEEHPAKVLFVFSGQGGQWHGMGRDLAAIGPAAREMADRVSELMPPLGGRPVLDALRDPDPAYADRTDVIQPLLFLQQVMLAAQLRDWGITAAAVCGHSVGEAAAAYWSGALSLEDAVLLVHHRSRLQEKTRGSGAMAAVGMSPESAGELCGRWRDVHVAAVNAPDMVTLAGDAEELGALAHELREGGVFFHLLPIPYAFHSPHMEPVRNELIAALASLSPASTHIPVFSTVTGRQLSGEALGAEYWWRNLREPVLFRDAVAAALGAGCGVVIELGPQPSLLRPAAQAAGAAGHPVVTLPTLQREQPALHCMMKFLGEAWSQGIDPDWSAVYPGPCAQEELPGHPWIRERHWLESAAVLSYRTRGLDHPLLGRRVYGPGARWEQMIDLARLPYLADHRVHGETVFPAAGYVEQMLAAGEAILGNVPIAITHLQLDRVLALDGPRLVHTEREAAGGKTRIWSDADRSEDNWVSHAQAHVMPSSDRLHAPPFPEGTPGTPISIEELYGRLDEGGNRYGPQFRCVRELWTNGTEAWGRLALDPGAGDEADSYRFHPALLDAALQMVLELLRPGEATELYLPLGVDRIEVSRNVGGTAKCLVQNACRGDGMLFADIYIYAEDGTPIALLEGCRCRAVANRGHIKAGPQAYAWRWHASPAEPAMPQDCMWQVWGFSDLEIERLAALVGPSRIQRLGEPAAPASEDGASKLVCWIRPNGTGREAPIEEPVLALVRLVQKLAGTDVELSLVTNGATSGHPATDSPEASDPTMAAVWALGRSLLTERPVAIRGLVDLECGTPVEQAVRQIGAVISEEPSPREIAWRGGQRFVHRFERSPPRLPERKLSLQEAGGYALTVAEPGSFDGLRWCRRSPPSPGPGQVAIDVEAVGINFRDVLKVLDLYPLERGEARLLGDECAGTVREVGHGVEGFAPGDQVLAIAPGCMASHAVTSAHLVAARKSSLAAAEVAAGVPIAFLTAWQSLVEIGRLRPGETVLIHAAAGGVGQAAIQIARLIGARVLATASPEKHAAVVALGAEAVFNSRDLSFGEAARAATEGKGVDLVLNSLAGEALAQGLEILKPFGRFIEIGKRDVYANRPLDLRALRDNRAFFTVDLASWIAHEPEAAGKRLREILRLIEDGRLHPVQTVSAPIRKSVETFRTISQGQHTGKLVFTVIGEAAPDQVVDPDPVIVRPDASYLITGGTSGLGLTVARYLAKRGARQLVLVSRSGRVPEPDRRCLDELRELGAELYVRACDVTDLAAVRDLLAELRPKLPPLRGVVHGAAVLDDVSVLDLGAANLDRVLGAKFEGASNLSLSTEPDRLDWFVMHGSVAASVGAPGQANYVIANYLLESVAADRRRRGLPAQVIAWGPLAERGMVARSERLVRYFELSGFTALSSAAVEQALDRALRSDEPSPVVVDVDWMRFAGANPAFENDARFAHLLDGAEQLGADGGDLGAALRGIGPERRLQFLTRFVGEQVAKVLGIDVDQVASDARLSDLGLDSLMSFELSAAFERALGGRLSLTVLQGNPTVAEIAGFLDRGLAQGDDAAAERAPPKPVRSGALDDREYLELRYLAEGAAVDPAERFQAAALTYIPDEFETKGGLQAAELRSTFGDRPFLSGILDAPIGRVGVLMLPLRGRDLFRSADRTCELVHDALLMAAECGARVTALTGLLPAATGYGEAVKPLADNGAPMAITTGHALTTAAIVANLADLLERCGRQLATEDVAMVGLGSVGRSVLELMLRELPHPRSLALCDLYANTDRLAAIRQHIVRDLGFTGLVEIAAGDAGLPDAVLAKRLIVSAVDRTGLVDPALLQPGTIVLDDSYPPTFAPEAAWAHMETAADIVIASGGYARLPGIVREALYVPASARPFLQAYGEENFVAYYRRDPRDYTACVFAGPLALRDELLQPAVGIPTPEALQAFYAALRRHGIGPASPHCVGRPIPPDLFTRLRALAAPTSS